MAGSTMLFAPTLFNWPVDTFGLSSTANDRRMTCQKLEICHVGNSRNAYALTGLKRNTLWDTGERMESAYQSITALGVTVIS